MDNRAEVREFLISRRAKITPRQAGLPEFGARRVPWLRRGEVAALAAALYDTVAEAQPNFARFTFLNLDAAHSFYPEWDGAADTCVAILRTESGRDPHDKDLHDLVGELCTRSDEFRRRWSAHNVRYRGAGTKHFHTTTSATSNSPTKAST